MNCIPFELPGFRICAIETQEQLLTITAEAESAGSRCPSCGKISGHVHSHYERHPMDLPSGGRSVRLVLWVRRFRCRNASCPVKVFCERVPAVVARSAQRTVRLTAILNDIGFALGGEAGSHLSKRQGMPASATTLLRYIRRYPIPARPTPRVLGVDDFALHRGHRYGTLLVDDETHRPVDLLADRTAERLADWLQAHPGVQVITRDRSTEYARGASQGAPTAIQVADRWHLLKNLSDMLGRVLSGHQRALNRLAQSVGSPLPTQPQDTASAPALVQASSARPQPSRRAERHRQVHALHTQGFNVSAIARQVGVDRKTVRNYLAHAELASVSRPKRQVSHYRSRKLAPYEGYLLEHWQDGRRTVRQLYQDVREQGYTGCLTAVADFLSYVRKTRNLPAFVGPDLLTPGLTFPYAQLRPKTAAWLLIADPTTLTDHELALATALPNLHPDIQFAAQAAQRFTHMLRQRAVDQFDAWLFDMFQSSVPQLRAFARSLQQDEAAVRAALTLPFSNGITEGHVNRLKLIKRSMYGRANFDLLRCRVLAVA